MPVTVSGFYFTPVEAGKSFLVVWGATHFEYWYEYTAEPAATKTAQQLLML